MSVYTLLSITELEALLKEARQQFYREFVVGDPAIARRIIADQIMPIKDAIFGDRHENKETNLNHSACSRPRRGAPGQLVDARRGGVGGELLPRLRAGNRLVAA